MHHTRFPSNPTPTRNTSGRPPATAIEMAEIISERTINGGGCTEDDLITLGFTQVEMNLHGERARKIARDAGVMEIAS